MAQELQNPAGRGLTPLPEILKRPEQHTSFALCVSRFKKQLNFCGQEKSLTHLSLFFSC